MTKAELEERLTREPFEPFRVNTSDGKHYDVVNPRLAVPMDTRLFIALPQDRWTLLVLRHITGMQDVPRQGSGGTRRRRT
jgi:hypothetical protein